VIARILRQPLPPFGNDVCRGAGIEPDQPLGSLQFCLESVRNSLEDWGCSLLSDE
jgi:hypothetical protein